MKLRERELREHTYIDFKNESQTKILAVVAAGRLFSLFETNALASCP